MKSNIVFIFIFTVFMSFSQNKTCNTPKEEVLLDMSSITKCAVESSKKANNKNSRQIKVNVSASKTRFLKKRTHKKKSLAKHNVISLFNNLSKEEVKKAKKFNEVDKIPVFKACKKLKGKKRAACFNDKMIQHINDNFKYPSDAILNKVEGEVWVRFVIDNNGNVTNLKALGAKGKQILKNEALRVVSALPKFVPGEYKGKHVSVKYGFPINFSLEQ